MGPDTKEDDQDATSVPVKTQPSSSTGASGAPPLEDEDLLNDSEATTQPASPSIVSPSPVSSPQDVSPGPASTPSVTAPVGPTPPPPADSQPPVAPPAHKSGRPMGAIIAAIVIALLLAGLAVAVYLKTKDSVKPVSNNSTSTAPPPAAAVKASDVDKTAADIDNTLSTADKTDDISANDLTDQNLGL